MDKYKNKYRNQSARLRHWDYGSQGIYFITICTKSRLPYFGKIENKKMHLSDIGEYAYAEWLKTPHLRADTNIELGACVVMPDHFHALIGIGDNKFNCETNAGGIGGSDGIRGRDARHGVPTMGVPTMGVPTNGIIPANKFGPQSNNLASILRGYKSAVTTLARKNKISFGWQERFHDHIVRNHNEFAYITDYIESNVSNWKNP